LPELPDVETFRRYLGATSLHKEIAEVELRSPEMLVGTSVDELKELLRGSSFESTRRHGKYLFVAFDSQGWLTFHFGMTGHLKYFKDLGKDTDYDRLLISFTNGYHLAYDAMRKLGEVQLIDDVEGFVAERGLGPDALGPDLDEGTFVDLVSARRGMIKSALMDQHLIAGIGNIYSDEILFQAGIHPRAEIQGLSKQQVSTIFQVMHEVLRTAIERHADPQQFPESYLNQHREKGGKCPICGQELQRVTVSGRTGYFCPNRQGPGP
jgi:formamidopyrimidine-DNA glycosylase